VLCTDGIHSTLTKDEIVENLNGDPNHASEIIIEAVSAKKLDHQDNASIAIIACEFTPPDESTVEAKNERSIFTSRLALLAFLLTVIAIFFSLGVYAGLNWHFGQ
jgi:hypothetical protein